MDAICAQGIEKAYWQMLGGNLLPATPPHTTLPGSTPQDSGPTGIQLLIQGPQCLIVLGSSTWYPGIAALPYGMNIKLGVRIPVLKS